LNIIANKINKGGKIILKEVDQFDRLDKKMTTFFDSKLYPNDPLSYRTVDEWLSVFSRLGISKVDVKRVHTLWPASRTLLFAQIPSEKKVGYDNNTDAIQKGNLNVNDNTKVTFITGGTGFIGRYVTRHLLEKGLGGNSVRVILLIRNITKLPSEFSENPNVVPLLGDLQDLPSLKKALVGVDYVFHLAAEVKFFKGADIWRNNYQGTLSLLEALKGIKLTRFMYASTIGALDRSTSDPCTKPLDETAIPNPLSEYGKSKLKAEIAVKESEFNYTIVRIPWAYGEGMTPDTHVRKLMQSVNDKKIFSLFNFPGRVSIITAFDIARAFAFLAENESTKNETFFVTDGEPISLGNLFKLMGNTIGKKAGFIPIPKILTKTAKKLRPIFPLPIQNLNSDVLTASNQKITSIGFKTSLNKKEGMQILAKSMDILNSDFNKNERLVTIVTGAASGIGAEIAKELFKIGHRLFLIDIRKKELEILANELSADFIILDLTKIESLHTLEKHLESNNYVLDCVINNAGIGGRGNFETLEFLDQKKIIDLNCITPVFLSQLALNHFKKLKRGTLINIASTAAYQPLPYMAIYAASKSFILNFSEAITGELLGNKKKYPIEIITVSPSGTDTNFQSSSNVKKGNNDKLLSPESVASIIVNKIGKGSRTIIIGRSGKMMSLLSRITPTKIRIKLWEHFMRKMR
jgi:short-subunit dehydrogenase